MVPGHPLQRQVPVMTYTQPGMGITTIEAGKWPFLWKGLQNIDMKWHFPVTIVDSIQYITSLRAWILQIYEVDSHQAARQRNLIATWEVPAHADKQFYDAMLRLLAADPSHVMLFWCLWDRTWCAGYSSHTIGSFWFKAVVNIMESQDKVQGLEVW